MALLVFPPNPYNGEIFPVNPPAGVNVYQWDSPDQTWRLLGTATGVVPGTYGSPTEIPVFTVDVVGRLVAASQVPLAVATTTSTGVIQVGANLEITGAGILSVPFASNTQAGVVELTDSSTDCSPNKALSGVVGCYLQSEIDALKAETHLTFAGTVNATTGRMTSITAKGAAAGFTVGGPMVAPAPTNVEYLVIVSQPGTFAPPNSLSYNCTVGDWLVSNGVQWIFYNVGPEAAILVQLDDISGGFNGTQQTFPLTLGGVPYTPNPQSNILVSLGGVLQMPGTAFTISGSTIDFADPPVAGTTFLSYVISGATGGGGGGGGGTGTVTSVGTGLGLSGGPITSTGTISLRVATPLSLGGVIPDGTTITVSPSGVISAAPISGANLQQITNNGSITTNSITTGGLVSNGSVTLGSSPIDLLNVIARVSSNFIPSANQTYDLGSATNRWRDLYVSSNSIYMGSNQLTVSGGQLLLNGVPVGGGATLQQVTNNGATTTNNITLDNSDLLVKDGSGNTRIQLSAGTSLFSDPVSMASSGAATTNPILTIGNSNSILWSGGSSQTVKISNQSIRFGMGVHGIDIYGQSVSASSSYSLFLPNAQGAAGTTLINDGSGQLSWGTGGGGTVGTLQTVTDNGAFTTNAIAVGTSASGGLSLGQTFPQLASIFASGGSNNPSLVLKAGGAFVGGTPGNVIFRNAYDTQNNLTITEAGDVSVLSTLTTGNKVGINGPTGISTLTVNGTITSDTVTTTGNCQIVRGGIAVGLLSGDIGSSYLPSLSIAGLNYPTADGTSGQVLTTNGAGTLSWTTVGGGSVGTLQTVTDNGATTTNNITVQSSTNPTGENVTVYSNLINILNGRIQVQTGGLPGINIDSIGTPSITMFGGGSISMGTGTNIYTEKIKLDGNTGKVGINSPIGADTLTVGGTAYSSGNTGTGGDFQIVRSGTLVGLLSGSSTTPSYLPSPLSLPDGSVSSPSLRFASAQNTGFYYDSTASSIYITNNGNYEIQIGNNTTTFFSDIQVPNSYTASFTGTLSFNQSGGNVRFYDSDNSNYVGFRGPSVVTSDVSWILPSADGAANEVIATDGAGNLGWLATAEVVAEPGSSLASGSPGQIAFGNGFFYWFDPTGNQWLRVAGNTF